jgi:hypothetical protein
MISAFKSSEKKGMNISRPNGLIFLQGEKLEASRWVRGGRGGVGHGGARWSWWEEEETANTNGQNMDVLT